MSVVTNISFYVINDVKILQVNSFYQHIVLRLEHKLDVTYQELYFLLSLVVCFVTLQ